MAIVAAVDFGTFELRVAIVDRERGLLASAVVEYPLHRKREDPEYATQSAFDLLMFTFITQRSVVQITPRN